MKSMSIIPLPEELLHHHHLRDISPFIDQCVHRDFRQRLRIKTYFDERFKDMIHGIPYTIYLDLNKIVEDLIDVFIKSSGLYFSTIMNVYQQKIIKAIRSMLEHIDIDSSDIHSISYLEDIVQETVFVENVEGKDEETMKLEDRLSPVFDFCAGKEYCGTYYEWFMDLFLCMGVDEGFYSDMGGRFDDFSSYMDERERMKGDFVKYIKEMYLTHGNGI